MTNDELVARAAEKYKDMRDTIIESGGTGNDFEIAFAFAALLTEMDHRSEERIRHLQSVEADLKERISAIERSKTLMGEEK